MDELRLVKVATIVILSFAVSTSSKLRLVIAMARSRLGMRSALGVFLCMEYNRNSRFNFVGKGSTGRRWDSQADRSDRSVGTFHNRLQSQLSEFSRRLRGKVEVGNRSILKELPFSALSSGGLPKYTGETLLGSHAN